MLKILMLGWEFPPLFSGGLGVATHGIVKSLSRKARVQLIIPNSTGIHGFENVNIIGMNKETLRELELEKLAFDYSNVLAEVHRIPVAVSPYHESNRLLDEMEHRGHTNTLTVRDYLETIHNLFNGTEVYGPSIMRKVSLFASLVEKMTSEGNFDIIHAHDWVTFPAAINVKMRTGKPLVIHVHALETDRAGTAARNEIFYLEQRAMQLADLIFAVSEFTKNQILEHYKISADKIIVVHNGIDPANPQKQTRKLRDKIVVFLGRLTHQKGPDFLIDTAEKVLRIYPSVKFVVAGTGDQFIHAIEKTAAKRLGRNFLFTGFMSKNKVNDLLSMADVYFMPSVSEPFGLTALEAAQHRVPSVLSSQSGASEVLRASLHADYWDTDKYANYIFALLKYNKLSKELSGQSKDDADKHTWDYAVDKMWNAYQQLLM